MHRLRKIFRKGTSRAQEYEGERADRGGVAEARVVGGIANT